MLEEPADLARPAPAEEVDLAADPEADRRALERLPVLTVSGDAQARRQWLVSPVAQQGERPQEHLDALAQAQPADEEQAGHAGLLDFCDRLGSSDESARGVGQNGGIACAVVPGELRGGRRARRQHEIGGARRAPAEEDLQGCFEAAKTALDDSRLTEHFATMAQRADRAALLDIADLQERDQQRADLEACQPGNAQGQQAAVGFVQLHDVRTEGGDPAQCRTDDGEREEDLRPARGIAVVAASPEHLDLVATRAQPRSQLQHLLADAREVVRRQGVGDQQNAHRSHWLNRFHRCVPLAARQLIAEAGRALLHPGAQALVLGGVEACHDLARILAGALDPGEVGGEIGDAEARQPGLPRTEEVAGTADRQVGFGDGEAVAGGGEHVEPLRPLLGQPAVNRQTVRRCAAPPDTAAQLMELRQAEALGALDDHPARVGDVDADLDHGRGDQDLDRPGGELLHDPLALHRRDLSMQDGARKVDEVVAHL